MKKLLLFLFLTTFLNVEAQQEDAWVYLKNKPNAAAFIANPLTMLSQRAIDRRARQNIALDEKDAPIHTTYYNQLKSDGTITILGKSKWLNAIHVQGAVADINALLSNYNFIESIEFATNSLNASTKKRVKQNSMPKHAKFEEIGTDFNYGETENQVTMLKADFLHQQGFAGEGMQIAVIDAGFPNVNTLPAFKRLRNNNQILGGYNFADRNTNFYSRSSHGTHVLSTIAGFVENEFVGTAPNAKFYLFISEISETETVLEETLWVEAAERSDSLGVDVINTSLGYTYFDNPNHDYIYADMNGETTFISRGAEIGASRGMILVTSAGNDGNNSWKYISAPADAKNVFTIGAVNSIENIATFSSYGPTADNRIKPDVLAKGQGTAIINYSTGNITTSNGTSFSSPVMAGVVACFWQAYPNKTNIEIMDLIRESADRFSNPTEQYGYGIPDFQVAYNQVLSLDDNSFSSIDVFPNPVTNKLFISKTEEALTIAIYTVLGKKVYHQTKKTTNAIDVSFLNKGIYIVKIQHKNNFKTLKLLKQ